MHQNMGYSAFICILAVYYQCTTVVGVILIKIKLWSEDHRIYSVLGLGNAPFFSFSTTWFTDVYHIIYCVLLFYKVVLLYCSIHATSCPKPNVLGDGQFKYLTAFYHGINFQEYLKK